MSLRAIFNFIRVLFRYTDNSQDLCIEYICKVSKVKDMENTIVKDTSFEKGEIVVYQPDEITKLDVKVSGDTVWLTQTQMANLFQRERTVITKHIKNIFAEKELDENSNVQILHFANSDKPVKIYSLDVIISVGYRVKSVYGTRFRQWANKVIKEYMLRGYAVNYRIALIDEQLASHEKRLMEHEEKINFFIRTSQPPVEGIFYDGQIFDAYAFVANIIRSAKDSVILIDNYIDEDVFLLLAKRKEGVRAEIYTGCISKIIEKDVQKHNMQYPSIKIVCRKNIHDRFLIIDNDVYHIGASFKDLGKKLFAFSKMSIPKQQII